jgi:hypothetical protein
MAVSHMFFLFLSLIGLSSTIQYPAETDRCSEIPDSSGSSNCTAFTSDQAIPGAELSIFYFHDVVKYSGYLSHFREAAETAMGVRYMNILRQDGP